MFKTFATAGLTAIVLLGSALPASAANCTALGSSFKLSFGMTIGKKMTEREKADFAMMALRQRGVDATRVEFWGGCLRAFVRQPGGREIMEYYNPETLERVD